MATTGGILSPAEQRGYTKLSSIFQMGHKCHRCEERVYHTEKVGPIKEAVFHKSCFKCFICGQHLTIRNFLTNQVDLTDTEVCCSTHAGKNTGRGLDGGAMGIAGALRSQNMYRRATNSDINHSAPLIDSRALGIKRALTAPSIGVYNEQIHGTKRGPHIDSSAMYIQGALNAQDLRSTDRVDNNMAFQFPAVITKKRQEIIEAQKDLEEKLREEEDELYKEFKNEREEEKKKLSKELEVEWEVKLKELTEKFDRDYGKKMKKMKDNEKKAMTIHLNAEKGQLEKNLNEQKKKKQQYMTLKVIEKEQALTTDLLKKHSEQMLSLLAEKQREAQVEIQQELMRAREQEIKENGETAEVTEHMIIQDNLILQEALESLGPATAFAPTEIPGPAPPAFRKADLYQDVNVFNDLDDHVFGIAEADHNSWTDLIHQLTYNCLTDLEKARAIFRWITVKDLNMIEFEETVDSDTPLGILRGIKYGTETYHVLFMRMCSYAGLHCVEIKGKSKSVGYEPGMKFKEDLFNNTWNAVLIDGEWRLIQCNWGARHLVLNKDNTHTDKKNSLEHKSKKKDKIRYQYDEHYFLTDPDEFILEFMAAEPQWQLLERPITIEEFQQLPFVRSVFFHYGMKFMDSPRAVLRTNSKGGTEVKIRVPPEHIKDVVFHYQLRFADKERRQDTDYKGAKVERFVFQTMLDDHVVYSIHVPTSGEYFLEIFANKIDDSHRVGEDPNSPMMPFRLKCACKFRVICDSLQNKMHPLPCCAAGEWGPAKSIRHFDLIPVTHRVGVISPQTDRIEIKFKIPRPLHFLAKLRKNGIDDHALDRFVDTSVSGNELTVSVLFPESGQYGLDLYARPERAADSQTLAHAAKYLINMEKVSQTIELDVTKVDAATLMSKDKWGALPMFEKLGMRALSHRDAKIRTTDSNQLTIEMGISERLQISYHLIREPDEDHREHVTVARNEEGRKVKFFVNMLRPGNYLFAIYAKQDTDPSRKMVNVFNYMIKYSPDGSSHINSNETPKRDKKSGLFGKK